jgi:acyl transferase domain-containing protein
VSPSAVATVLVFEGQGARTVPGEPPVDLTGLPPAEAQAAIVRHQVARAQPWRRGGHHAVLGQSLGEVAALVVAGAVALDDAVEVVRLRAELPGRLLEPREWTMASLTRVRRGAVEAAATDLDLWVIGDNGPADCVVVAVADHFATFAERLRLNEATYRELPVRHPYHTPLMQPVADEVAAGLVSLDVHDPVVPVVSPTGPRSVLDAADVRAVLVDALVSPVAWSAALKDAAGRWPDARWRECGPSGSLQRFVWKNNLTLDWAEA